MTRPLQLVTGGTGFIGSALTLALLDRGHAVRVFDNNFRGRNHRLATAKGALEMVEGDIRDEAQVARATEGVHTVHHLAFINGTRHFYEIPDQVLDVGTRGALSTLKAALEKGVKRYVLASSSEVYQTPERVPTDETERILLPDVTNPRYSYAGGKIISELLTLNYLRASSVEGVIFRPHNVFGPDMGFEHVVPELARKMFDLSAGFTKKAIDLPIQGQGTETRAFCFVDDAVEQIIACAEKGGAGEIYHIGDTAERSILDLVEAMARVYGIKVTVVPGPLRPGGTPRRCPDIAKVRALGASPKVGFEAGLERTLAWYADHFTNNF
ncbi:dTDP-glucose 4,6-dehydratase [Fundidesulfovibrio magnetotacticus]|uniref:dTDP-glucose 4,6-dehydratase n=1 Tax=Fundidesulfovibrio magnetotacticus TaxID=2730080 RepID=A0A6V8M314_9BACT|nr:NAD-dependent epimerase/dehydratase family protein [Fundidesulfovibrio magnetotacticus]GFK94835.1 dTDP-glucose 4,6-dehydratase [Fundidesulfovibrio magnetotacticus]